MRTSLLGLVFVAACGSSGSRNPNPDASADAISDGAVPGDGSIAQGTGCGAGHAPCAANEYCDYADNGCGASDTGTCMPRPEACPAVVGPPVCGCDGQVYASACTAFDGGTDLDAQGRCTAVPGHFLCGYEQCQTASEYCHHQRGGDADIYACAALPLACAGSASCECLKSEPCGNMCTGDPATGLTLTCPPQ